MFKNLKYNAVYLKIREHKHSQNKFMEDLNFNFFSYKIFN